VTTRRFRNGESSQFASSTLISSTKGIKHLLLLLQLHQLNDANSENNSSKWKTSIIAGALLMPILDRQLDFRIFSGESWVCLIPTVLRVAFQLPRFSQFLIRFSYFSLSEFLRLAQCQIFSLQIVTSNLCNTIQGMQSKNLFREPTAICRSRVL